MLANNFILEFVDRNGQYGFTEAHDLDEVVQTIRIYEKDGYTFVCMTQYT